MKLTFIYNSGFLLETGNCNILFDYYRKGHDIIRQLLTSPLPLYVLVSHSHADHFNPDCLGWKSKHKAIHYIFSDELQSAVNGCDKDIVFLPVGGIYSDDVLKVEAFGSTDIGCSFYLTIGDTTVFHAGDLNNWHWSDESTPGETMQAEHNYINQLDYLAAVHNTVHLAMFPVDARIGSDYARGARQFLEAVHTDVFVPMHFWSAADAAAAFAPEAQKAGARFVMLRRTGQWAEV